MTKRKTKEAESETSESFEEITGRKYVISDSPPPVPELSAPVLRSPPEFVGKVAESISTIRACPTCGTHTTKPVCEVDGTTL